MTKRRVKVVVSLVFFEKEEGALHVSQAPYNGLPVPIIDPEDVSDATALLFDVLEQLEDLNKERTREGETSVAGDAGSSE